MKIINLSFQRNATQSTFEFLNSCGFLGIHHINNIKHSSKFKNYSLLRIEKHIRPYENNYVHFSDAPYFLMYEYFEKKHPKSKFILITRNKYEWLNSFKKLILKNEIDPVSMECYKQFFKENKNNITTISDLSDKDLLSMYETHNNNVLEYFKGKDSLLHLDINDPYKGKKISNFVGILTDIEFDQIDYLKDIL
jgi:hypothetical protein